MFIQKLVIYGFGQHDDMSINLKDGINVFFGWNEAGKTTIQQFILSVLFGFPHRNQGILRYEPKGGGRYGGQVHMKHPEFGDVIIERVKGKSAGDVTVFFEDGRTGEEEALQQVLYHYNRASFESIFSFSIHQLQEFEKMTEEELSRTLFASGTTGIDSMTKLEQKLMKEMNALFKKSGKNPEMNVKIEEVRTLDQSLKAERVKIDQYEPLNLRISEIDLQLLELKNEEQHLKQQYEQLAKYRQAKPLLEKQVQIETELSTIKQLVFPPEGIRRYEALKDRVQELNVQIDQLQKDSVQTQLQLNEKISSEHLKAIEELLSKESQWHQWLIRKQQLKNEVEQTKREMQQQARMLGIQNEVHFNLVKEMDVSLQKEEYFHQVMQRLQHADDTVRFEKQSIERLQFENEEIEWKIQQLKTSEPSEKEVQQVAKQQLLIRKLAELKAQQHHNVVPSNRLDFPLIVCVLIFLSSIIGTIILGNWGIATGGFILAVLIFILLKKMDQTQPEIQKKDLTSEMTLLEEELTRTEMLEHRVRSYNDRLFQLTDHQQEKQQVIRKIEENSEIADRKREEANETLNQFLQQYGFDGLLQPKLFPELFNRIRQIQELHQKVFEKSTEIQDIDKNIEHRLKLIMQVTNESFPVETAYHRLREIFNAQVEVQKDQVVAQKKVSEWAQQLTEKQKIVEIQSHEIQSLWDEAKVDTEATFYEADTLFRKKQLMQQDLKAIKTQLDAIGTFHLLNEENQDITWQIDQLDEQSKTIMNTHHQLLEEKALLKQQVRSLLSDLHYGQILQQFEQKKAELAELARKWSVNKAASEAIKQTMHHLKEKRLPYVLQQAQKYFIYLTNGCYDSLVVNETGIFEAVNPKGIRFRMIELSQATKEQAYISLRFALAESLIDSVPLPIVMDDPFVHFDRFRVKQMVQLMTDLESNHQFLYFTCHEEMTTIWPQAHVIDVAALKKERSVPAK